LDNILFWDLDNINLKDETLNILKDKENFKIYFLKNKELSKKRREIFNKIQESIHFNSTFIKCENVDNKIFEMVKEYKNAKHIIIVSNDKDFFKLSKITPNLEIITLKPHKSEKNIIITKYNLNQKDSL
jgi:hypothetical protein